MEVLFIGPIRANLSVVEKLEKVLGFAEMTSSKETFKGQRRPIFQRQFVVVAVAVDAAVVVVVDFDVVFALVVTDVDDVNFVVDFDGVFASFVNALVTDVDVVNVVVDFDVVIADFDIVCAGVVNAVVVTVVADGIFHVDNVVNVVVDVLDTKLSLTETCI